MELIGTYNEVEEGAPSWVAQLMARLELPQQQGPAPKKARVDEDMVPKAEAHDSRARSSAMARPPRGSVGLVAAVPLTLRHVAQQLRSMRSL